MDINISVTEKFALTQLLSKEVELLEKELKHTSLSEIDKNTLSPKFMGIQDNIKCYQNIIEKLKGDTE